jgi:hypothetical protein
VRLIDALLLMAGPRPSLCRYRAGGAEWEHGSDRAPRLLAPSFAHLVARLCRSQHDESVLAMQRHSRVSHSTLGRWVRGDPESFHRETVNKFCLAYGLPLRDVWSLIHQDDLLRLDGYEVPVPTLDWVKVAPKFKTPKSSRRRRRR